jgi:hypothetical protein
MKNKRIISALLSTSLLLSVSAFAGGIPNLWVDGFVQGFETYDLTNSQGQHVNITCSEDAAFDESSSDNSVTLTNAKGIQFANDQNEFKFVIDDEVYVVPETTALLNRAGMWINFIDAIKSPVAGQFTVYIGDKEFGTFKASAKNRNKSLSDMKCTAKADWEVMQ